jgi:uncharacterized protein (DUF39 family)
LQTSSGPVNVSNERHWTLVAVTSFKCTLKVVEMLVSLQKKTHKKKGNVTKLSSERVTVNVSQLAKLVKWLNLGCCFF